MKIEISFKKFQQFAQETGSLFLMVNDCSIENGSCQTHLNFTRLCVLVNEGFSHNYVRYKSIDKIKQWQVI